MSQKMKKHNKNVGEVGAWAQSYQGLMNYLDTRKYPLRGYILGVLAHTTALDRLWGGAETLEWQFLER